MKTRFLSKARAFKREETGSITIETVIWVPLLLTIMGALFSIHHSWRAHSLNTKAAYAIADVLSRETDAIDDAYLDGMMGVMSYITGAELVDQGLRVTLVRFDQDADGYLVEWSQARGKMTELLDATGVESLLPVMFDEERVILVETLIDYTPPIEIPGLAESGFLTTSGITRPRFAPKIVWSDVGV